MAEPASRPPVSPKMAEFATGHIYAPELQNVDLRVAKIESTLQQVANVLVLSARQDEKMIAIERRLDRLEQPPAHR
jgi:hypothetical protein